MIITAPSRLWTMRFLSVSPTWTLLGIVAATRVLLVGEIHIGEVVALALLPFLLLQGRVSRNLVWLMALEAFVSAAPAQRPALVFGESWASCPFNIAMLSIPAFIAT